jgi:hypothetical protein
MDHLVKTPAANIARLRTLFWTAAAVLGMIFITVMVDNRMEPTKEVPPRIEYAGDWNGKFHLQIAKALVKNSVKFCSEFYWRQSTISNGQYMVLCSMDGSTWRAYLVWALSGDVMGPYDAPQDLPLPPK